MAKRASSIVAVGVVIVAAAAVLTALSSAISSGVAQAAGDPASPVGIWVHNKAESIGMPDPEMSETVEIRRYDTILDYTWNGVDAKGTKSTFSYSMAADGKVHDLPGSEGLRGSMTKTPSGVIDAKLFFPDGSSEDKFCILSAPTRLTCFATYVDAAGKTSLFKQVFDKR
jgi:hypothetical protein